MQSDEDWKSASEALVASSHGAWRLEFHERLDSTNRLCWQRGLEGHAQGLVVLADAQTSGRGRLQREWHSPPGSNLYFSMLLRPRVKLSHVALLNFVAAVAGARACHNLGAEVGIKWPNDLLARSSWKKLCGVLAELKSDGKAVDFVVLGVGLNVNLAESALPQVLSERATSLQILTGRPLNRAQVLAEFIREFSDSYSAFCHEELETIFNEWRRLNMTLGQRVQFELSGMTLEGVAEGLDEHGSLLVRTADGLVAVTAGDVGLVRAG